MKNLTASILLIAATTFPVSLFAQNSASGEMQCKITRTVQPTPTECENTHKKQRFHFENGLTTDFKFDIDTLKNAPKLNQILLKKTFGPDVRTNNPEAAMCDFIARAHEKHATPVGPVNEFSFFVSVKFSPKVGNRISALITREEFTGGAHGETKIECITFDLTEKKQIFLKDILKGGFERNLPKILQKYDPRHENTDFSYAQSDEEIPAPPRPTENFIIRDGSLDFYYPPYELDCRAAGTITVRVPASELQSLLK